MTAVTHVDLSHVITSGMVTYPGLPRSTSHRTRRRRHARTGRQGDRAGNVVDVVPQTWCPRSTKRSARARPSPRLTPVMTIRRCTARTVRTDGRGGCRRRSSRRRSHRLGEFERLVSSLDVAVDLLSAPVGHGRVLPGRCVLFRVIGHDSRLPRRGCPLTADCPTSGGRSVEPDRFVPDRLPRRCRRGRTRPPSSNRQGVAAGVDS